FAVRGVSATVEHLLLLISVPVSGLMAVVTGPRVRAVVAPVVGALVALGLVLVAPSSGMLIYLMLIKLAPWLLALTLVVAVSIELVRVWKSPDVKTIGQYRRPTLTAMATFYAGYGIGWLALWGYFGF